MMTPIVIKIDVPNRSLANQAIEALVAKLANPKGLLESIGEAELRVTLERFSTKTAPDGAAWKANSALTLMLAQGGSMMRRSGGLMGSINYTVGGNRLALGPNKIYAAIQQFGGTIVPKNAKALRIPIPAGTKMSKAQADAFGVGHSPRRGVNLDPAAIFLKKVVIPARPYIGVGPKDAEAIVNAVEDFFNA